ncbi:DUF4245 domain-containing protein [Actinomadura sp. NBRC 104412]|uniref:DUF4245 domain-containing protein n=1 Tax=Actinomadura sp. NBRC 104412 TaxID=3032203 RepID=UPI002557229C|nr:DUF4245 domain-containing protein [Actinomadura sp. NBRC 104412]
MTEKTSTPQEAAPPESPQAPESPAASRGTIEVSPGVYKRLTTGIGGFAFAMAVCLLLVGAIYLVSPRNDKELLPTVDYSSQLWAMRSDAPYVAYAPEGLPAGWRATSSRVHGLGSGGDDPVAWHLGFVTPTGEYAAVEQSNERASAYVPRMTSIKKTIGTQQVNGVAWNKHHRVDKNARSLVRTLPSGITIVVTGTASFEELGVLAAALRPQPKPKGNAPLSPSPAPS